MLVGIYIAILVGLGIYLSIRVVAVRRADQVSLGIGDNKVLERRVRAFGNYAEYTPLLAIILISNELSGVPALLLHVFGVGSLIGRFCHGVSFSETFSGNDHFRWRKIGMMATYLTLVVGAGTLAIASLF